MAVLENEVQFSKEVTEAAEQLGAIDDIPKIMELTKALFGGSPTIRAVEDPEISDWIHIVVAVKTDGTVEEIVEKHDRWHRDAFELVKHPSVFCLSLGIEE